MPQLKWDYTSPFPGLYPMSWTVLRSNNNSFDENSFQEIGIVINDPDARICNVPVAGGNYKVSGQGTRFMPQTIISNAAVITPGLEVWQNQTSPDRTALSFSMGKDASDNNYVCGDFNGTVDFGNGHSLTSVYFAGYIFKQDKDGITQWAIKIGGSTANDHLTSIAVNPDGTFAAAGHFYSNSLTVDGHTVSKTNAQISNAFVGQFTTGGVCNWLNSMVSAAPAIGSCVAVDSAKNVFFSAQVGGTVDFGNGFVLTGHGALERSFCKKDGTLGTTLWARMDGDIAQDTVTALTCDALDNLWLAGTIGHYDVPSGVSTTAIFVGKYANSDGSELFAKTCGTLSQTQPKAYAICSDPASPYDIWITGHADSGTVDFGSGTALSPGGVYIAHLGNDGHYIWQSTFGGGYAGYSIAVDGQNHLTFTGQNNQGVWGDGKTWICPNPYYFVAAYDIQGNGSLTCRWAWMANGTGDPAHPSNSVQGSGTGVVFDTTGHVIASGFQSGSSPVAGSASPPIVGVGAGGAGIGSEFNVKYIL